jgi:hypothetical protein
MRVVVRCAVCGVWCIFRVGRCSARASRAIEPPEQRLKRCSQSRSAHCARQIADALRKELVEAQKALSEMRARLATALTEQHKSEVGDISAAEERCDELELKLDEYQVQRRAAQCNVVKQLCTQWRCQRGRIRRPWRVEQRCGGAAQSHVTLTWAFAHCGVRSAKGDGAL